MALADTTYTRKDGELGTEQKGYDHISGLIFDNLQAPTGMKLGDVNQIFSIKDAEKLGITARVKNSEGFLHGIPHLHVTEFFRINPKGSLYIMFADCSLDWTPIHTMQSIAQGQIRQIGIWTPKHLWKQAAESSPYTVDLVSDINAQAEILASQHQPISVILCANTTSVDTTKVKKTIKLSSIPSCLGDTARVTTLIGQGRSDLIKSIQMSHPDHASVGCVGTLLGVISKIPVSQSFAYVAENNITGGEMSDIEFGFGDLSLVNDDKDFTSTLPFESVAKAQLDELDDKGYVFPIKYAGRENGTYFSKDRTCSDGDYCSINRNRTADKARRNTRLALLPFLHSPVLIDPKSGRIAELTIQRFKNTVDGVLSQMESDSDISGHAVTISPTQNVLTNKKILISYQIVPIGTAEHLDISEMMALSI